ncbi:MAG: nitrogenase [Drouetiella hepatica Uher 2000/2452]|uniref:Nitrogenase n=1 Tax=Drouetiella hepatica Uher 2000/2452 TaxID=904376 RepID=A0A951UNA7_9CYAN|nr:nitrogenase [Drouetiella hepatica Uher 2000/2452]
MVNAAQNLNAQTPYSDAQISAWLRGLLSIAWADGNFDTQEQTLIAELTQELAAAPELEAIETISPLQLADVLGEGEIAQNFMRMAVMVAIADGLYSTAEDEILHEFCVALGIDSKILESLRLTLNYQPSKALGLTPPGLIPIHSSSEVALDVLKPMQEWLDRLDVDDPRLARFLCNLIPAQCPFERDVTLFGRKLVHIPAMCKINPLYEQLVGLRFRALSYLADDCKEDVSRYC